jgi:hypothetical protein
VNYCCDTIRDSAPFSEAIYEEFPETNAELSYSRRPGER